MSLYRHLNRHPSSRELLVFGMTLLGVSVVVGGVYWFALHRPSVAQVLWIAGAVALLLSVTPRVGRWFYIGWMGLGMTLGAVTSPIVLFLLWGLFVTPLALLLRLTSRDPLRLRRDGATTFWESYSRRTDPRSYTKQF
jgi:hypothetical protein